MKTKQEEQEEQDGQEKSGVQEEQEGEGPKEQENKGQEYENIQFEDAQCFDGLTLNHERIKVLTERFSGVCVARVDRDAIANFFSKENEGLIIDKRFSTGHGNIYILKGSAYPENTTLNTTQRMYPGQSIQLSGRILTQLTEKAWWDTMYVFNHPCMIDQNILNAMERLVYDKLRSLYKYEFESTQIRPLGAKALRIEERLLIKKVADIAYYLMNQIDDEHIFDLFYLDNDIDPENEFYIDRNSLDEQPLLVGEWKGNNRCT